MFPNVVLWVVHHNVIRCVVLSTC